MRQPPFFLILSLCPKLSLSLPSPQPTAPSEKGPGRHNLRSPDLPRRHRRACRRKFLDFHIFFDGFVLSPPATKSNTSGFDGSWIGVPDTQKSQTLGQMSNLIEVVIYCHCSSTDGPLASWSRAVPGFCLIGFINGAAC
ncbi:hypothetical protein L3X38_042954 [Prunus dulcis]|uniref:Uncharacterized protein n=1 Tax=Prunus dulcis TaxID=3755 RepID=A0AAD4YMG5_PRUDU|nr:hypothetical protein L3X38_042954 [Prunus dulcis]